MQNLLQRLQQVLQKDDRLVIDGVLAKNKIMELALALDASLLKLLLSDESLKKHFFTEVDKTLVFDKQEFIRFVNNKNFLPDSYTSFKNKIGLMKADGTYVSQSKDVVLAFPYKDCVLEGGQDKEDAKRKEIFWNTTLAPDEIDRLLDPKVLTNFKKYDKDGEREITASEVDFEKENLIIKGNNLLALHSLEKRYAGKVKLIYIDPPYNTSSVDDSFRYNDSFNHSTWLTFMKNRLEIAKKLLTQDGAIYVQLDYNEVHYFKVLMDEIFDRENFQREIIWRIGWISGYKSAENNWIRNHDTILFYSKNNADIKFNKKYIPYTDDYTRRDGKKPLGEGYPYEDTWNCSDLDKLNSIAIVSFSKEKVGNFKGQKNESLIRRIIEAHTSEGEIVLDFFSGTGTTASVAQKMNRRWISIEQIESQIDLQINRLSNVVNGDQKGISKEVGWNGGGSFVYCELLKLNQNFVDVIQAAKSTKELLQIWEDMQKQGFLSYRLDAKSLDDNAEEFKNMTLEEKQKILLSVLDHNHLYVNYSEMEDADYAVSHKDKALNTSFYAAS